MRPPRKLIPDERGGNYHVTAGANQKEFIFESDSVKETFLQILIEARDLKKFQFEVLNFCIMSNHIHLMFKVSKGESISKLMQWILSVFAIRFNHALKRCGHVWYDRFFSTILNTRTYMQESFAYIAHNPVKAEIVEYPEHYQYNGVTHIINGDFSIIKEPPAYLLEKVILAPGIKEELLARQNLRKKEKRRSEKEACVK